MQTKIYTISEITKSAVLELELIALVLREVSTLKKIGLSLSDLILYHNRPLLHMPYFLQAIFSRVGRNENLNPAQLLDLNNSVIQTLDATSKLLIELPFTPRHQVPLVAGVLTSRLCFGVSDFASSCEVSQDTAQRWLDAATRSRVLRKLQHGNTFYYINELHYSTLQNLAFPLGEFPQSITAPDSSAGERFTGPKFRSYFPPYPQSVPPF